MKIIATIRSRFCVKRIGLPFILLLIYISLNSHLVRRVAFSKSVSSYRSGNAFYWNEAKLHLSRQETYMDNVTSHPPRHAAQMDAVSPLKYSVKLLPNLTQLINASYPKFPLTINAPYLIENPGLCSSVKNLTVLVVVNTATYHFEQRQAIRETWTNDTYYSDLGTVRVLFLLGRPVNRNLQDKIQREFEQHKDILQGDFIDTYYNITHKGVMGFKWLTERCRNPEFILKVDDDFMVNMFIYLRKIRFDKSLQTVNVYCHYRSEIIHKPKGNKWFVSEYQFRGVKEYLKFCRGKFVSMKNDILPSLYVSASKTPFFHLDDVLLFGYVMHNIPGLTYQTLEDKDMQENNMAAMSCLKRRKNLCPYFVIQASTARQIKSVWSTIVNNSK